MKTTTLPKNHYLLTTAAEMEVICKPVVDDLGVSIFGYMRYFNDNTFYLLTNNDKFLQCRLTVDCRLKPMVPANMLKEKFMIIPDDSDQSCKRLFNTYKVLNSAQPIYFIERHKGYFESFHFSAKSYGIGNKNSLNNYLNNLDVIEKFKFYFRDKARKLIENANQHKILAPEFLRPSFIGIGKPDLVLSLEESKALPKLDINRYFLTGKYEGITLSKREVDTMSSLASGHTIKEAAKLLGLAPRTAETYLNNIKNKLGLNKRSELVRFALENKL